MRTFAFALALIFCGCGTFQSLVNPDATPAAVLRAQKQKVIVVANTTCKEALLSPAAGISTGSGFLVNSTTVITVRHFFPFFMPNDPPMAVIGKNWCRDAKIVRLLPGNDILKLQIAPVPEKGLLLAKNNPAVGDEVYILKKNGKIERRHAFSPVGVPPDDIRMVFTDSPYFATGVSAGPGDSGAPVVDSRGRVVGMATSGFLPCLRPSCFLVSPVTKQYIGDFAGYSIHLSVRAIREILAE